jgi:gliding motility-associated-like protein
MADSNVFTNLPRGDSRVFVKDAYNCEPIDITVVVPNLVNVITPNGDGVNDVIDYSALGYKQNLVLSVFDRYGTLVFKADKFRNYTWDGTIGGKKSQQELTGIRFLGTKMIRRTPYSNIQVG